MAVEPQNGPRVVIIGAGFSGIGLGIELKKAGLGDFTILERADGIGGCWRANTYPGVACDIPSRLYSYSYEPNPDWSQSYSPGAEIRDYIERCAQKYDVTRHVRCNVAVVSIVREDDAWILTTDTGERIQADVVVPALGPLSDPLFPAIDGLDEFAGPTFHSARWDHGLELAGKRIGLIGSAASAAQILPEVAKIAERVTVFMRTPNWVIPRRDFPYGERQKAIMSRFPFLLRVVHRGLFWRWEANYSYIRRGSRLGEVFRRGAQHQMESQIPDPATRELLIPTYALGCKRIIMSSTYIPALQRSNVELVSSPITGAFSAGVTTNDGAEHALDVLVLATGYKNFDISQVMDIVGPDGMNLRDVWSEQAVTHRTTGVPGFPNFFIMMGPNTGLGHNSVTLMLEAQAKYIRKCVQAMRDRNIRTLTPRREPSEALYANIQDQVGATVLTDGCNAWYKNGPNGKVHSIWPGTARSYQRLLKSPALAEFDVAK